MNSLNFFITLFSCLLHFNLCLGDDHSMYTTCKYYSCGSKITNIGFPFWGGNSRPKQCGYPQLQLTCDENQTTHIAIMDMKFNVLNINQQTRVLTIVREDLLKNICLDEFKNTLMDFNMFNYAPGYNNITVLYGCPMPYTPQPAQFTCSNNGDSSSTSGHIEQGAQDVGSSGCSASVVVPVLESLGSGIDQQSSLEQAIDQGFGVEYRVANGTFCAKCEESKGVCGFVDSKISCFCADGSSGNPSCGASDAGSTWDKKTLSKLTIAIIACFSSTGILLIILCYIKRKCSSANQELQTSRNQDVEAFLRSYGTPGPKRYTYKDLKQITHSFKHKLGEGGYGTVYKGFLNDGQPVAVKLLKNSRSDNAGEFMNEVASIGMTNHVNVVTLLGFCYGSHKRALVYEFMPNGSLEKFVYERNNNQALDLKTLFQIAIGVARGLEYLHRGCNTRILHFDIKPHNILLDCNFCPKISDFGLAKLCPEKKSIISISEARGTVGYIAPEVFLRNFGGVSHKSDVYSYGMLVLEMVGLGCVERGEIESEVSYEEYFPEWIYKQLEKGNEINDSEEELSWEMMALRRKMILVSLWCVQINPSTRPSMTNVVEMLEGSPDSLQIPPTNSLTSSLMSQIMNPITSVTISASYL